jgi:hypothetical protein
MTEAIQATSAETQAAASYPHEIHITVAPPRNPRHFLRACEEIGVRACIFDNEHATGEHMTDFLTASDHKVPTTKAVSIMHEQADELTARGFTVIREKIETSPLNPMVPRRANADPQPSDSTYFETHFDVEAIGHNWLGRLTLIENMGPVHPVLLSVNRKKPDEFLATFRMYGVYLEDFASHLEVAQGRLSHYHKITPDEVEFASHDTNPAHDKNWVNSYYEAVY